MKGVLIRLCLTFIGVAVAYLIFTDESQARIRIDDVVGMWLFDEIEKDGDRKVVRDESGRGHDGSVMGDPALVEGKIGKALAFGKGRYVEVADHADLRITDTITISAWIKRPLPKDATDLRLAPFFILDKGGIWAFDQDGEANYGIALHKILDNMFFFFYRGGWKGTSGIQDDNWHHYVAVAREDGRDVMLYIDGQLRPAKHSDGQERIQMFPSKKPLHIGALIPERFDSYSETMIDEVIIFDTDLSSGDVDQLRGGVFAVLSSGKIAVTWADLKQGQ